MDGDIMLTGRAEYLDDVTPARCIRATVVRSVHAHARIKGINVDQAKAAPGVRAVLTPEMASEMAGPLPHFFDPAIVGGKTAEVRCLSGDVVRYVGEPIVAVAADTLAQAEAAAKLVEIDYEVLPAIVDAKAALLPGAPRVYEDWDDNVVAIFPFVEGDAATAIANAPHQISGELDTQRFQTAPMETRGYIGSWDRAGKLTLWGSTQNPHPVRSNLSNVLGLREDYIQVIATRLGGGFGHKFNGYQEEALVCLLSKLAGVPVKWIETRAESLLVGAREFSHDFTVGFDNDGLILGIQDKVIGNVGCLASWGGWAMTFTAGMSFPGPYKVPDYDIQSYAVTTNKAPWCGARGYGKEQATLCLERIVDLIAEELSLDPVTVRMRNFIPEDEFPFWTAGMHLDSGNYSGALTKVLDLADYPALRLKQQDMRSRGKAFGIGVGFELIPESGDFAGSFVRGYDTSTVRVLPTGAVTVLSGVTSPGTGNETSFAYLVANELTVPVGDVSVLAGDTNVSPYGFGSFGSRSLATSGAAAVLAAREIREGMIKSAAVLLEVPVEDIELRDAVFKSKSNPLLSISFRLLADTLYRRALASPGLDQPLLEVTRYDQPHNFHHVPDEKGRFSPYPSFPYSAHVAVVEVDEETGLVTLSDYFAIDDCGNVVSPVFVRGQLFGAIAMGIGGALWENLPYDEDGNPLAGQFKHYLTPRASDLPDLKLASQYTPSPFTLLGTKGAGESGLGGAMASVTNAVNDALLPSGVRSHRLPHNAVNVLDAIYSQRKVGVNA
jgi:carbon-monoxide dehydrogenase large subunit